MTKISPHYKTDADEGLPEAIRDYLDATYIAKLPNIEKTNPKVAVVFSAGNAVGKSAIAERLRDELGALVIENDGIKRCILQLDPDIDRDTLNRHTWQYTINLYPRLGDLSPNGLLVRDGIIDWYFDRILPVLQEAGFELFIVGLDISLEKAKELIAARGDTPTVEKDRLYVLLADHKIHRQRFRAQFTPDIILNDETLFQHDRVVDAVRAKLASQNHN